MLVYLSFRSFIFDISLASSIPEQAYHLQALGIQALTETENGFMEPKYLAFSEVMKDTPTISWEYDNRCLGKIVLETFANTFGDIMSYVVIGVCILGPPLCLSHTSRNVQTNNANITV